MGPFLFLFLLVDGYADYFYLLERLLELKVLLEIIVQHFAVEIWLLIKQPLREGLVFPFNSFGFALADCKVKRADHVKATT